MYAFAFLELPIPRDIPSGWQGHAVEFVQAGQLAAAVDASIPWETIQTDDAQLLNAALLHDRVICDLFRQQPVLPLCFGTVFISVERLKKHLEQNSRDYQQRLRTLRGMGEYTLKLLPCLAHPELDDGKEPELEKADLTEKLHALYPQLVHGAPQSGVDRVHLLLPVRDGEALLEQMSEWQTRYHCWRFDLQGPLPPYHFA
ncbi:MAG: GvpL/GvpF family gas vesicle protein [Gemmatimonadaceae bacterium]|nr:GvpL/GvpF family gas vesicle protein [Gloeobacterales cyanobacterium ES-bin-141]